MLIQNVFPIYNGPLAIDIKLKVKENISHGRQIIVLHSTKRIPFAEVAYFSKIVSVIYINLKFYITWR
jgi:hypothetical protein